MDINICLFKTHIYNTTWYCVRPKFLREFTINFVIKLAIYLVFLLILDCYEILKHGLFNRSESSNIA